MHRRVVMDIVKKVALTVVLTAVCLLPGAAGAAEATGVMVFPYQAVYGTVPDDVAAKTTELIISEMGNSDRLRAIPGPKMQEAVQAAPVEVKIDQAAIKKAVASAKTGAAEVKAQNYDQAVRILKDAIATLEANAEYMEDLSPLVDAYLNISVAYLGSGEEDACEGMIDNVVRLDPTRQLDPKDYVPLYLRMFHARRTAIYKQPRGSIIVTSSPAGASIKIDGRQIGSTPAILKELIKGTHYVKVEKSGEPARYKKVNVPAGGQAEARFETATASGGTGPEYTVAAAIKSNKLEQPARAQLISIAQKSGAEYVLTGGVTRADNVYQVNSYLIKVKTSEISPLVTLFFDVDLLGASIEVYKMVEEVNKRLDSFPEGMKQQTVLVVPGIMKVEDKPAEIVAGPVGAPPPLPVASEVPEEPVAPAAAAAVAAPVVAGSAIAPAVAAQPAKPVAPVVAQPAQPAKPLPQSVQPKPSTTQDQGNLGLTREGRKLSGQQQIDPSIVIVEHPKRWYEQWWVWTIVGAAVVGAGLGTYFYLAGQAPNHGQVQMTWPQP
jgi:hypothetical protein